MIGVGTISWRAFRNVDIALFMSEPSSLWNRRFENRRGISSNVQKALVSTARCACGAREAQVQPMLTAVHTAIVVGHTRAGQIKHRLGGSSSPKVTHVQISLPPQVRRTTSTTPTESAMQRAARRLAFLKQLALTAVVVATAIAERLFLFLSV